MFSKKITFVFIFLFGGLLSFAEEASAPLVEITISPEQSWDDAWQEVRSKLSAGQGVMVILQSGIYQRAIDLRGFNASLDSPPLIIRAAEAEKAIFSDGGGMISGLTHDTENKWTATWKPEKKEVRLYQRDFLFKRVDAPEKVTVGTYFYDHAKKEIVLQPFFGKKHQIPEIRYSFSQLNQPFLLGANIYNLAIRGIHFQRMESLLPMLSLDGGGNWEITDCLFEDGRGDGLSLRNAEKVSLSGLKILRNGLNGLSLFNCQEIFLQGLEASHNEQQGILSEYGGNTYGKYIRLVENKLCGWKVYGGKGLWTFESGFAAKNGQDGLSSLSPEAVLFITASEISFNFGAGVRLLNTASEMTYNILVGNGIPSKGLEPLGQIVLENASLPHKEHRWNDNILMGTIPGVPLFDLPLVENDFSFLRGAKNLFYQKYDDFPVRILHIGLSLARYQELTGSDLNSYAGDPLFYDIEEFDYQLNPQSPIYQKQNWTTRSLDLTPSEEYQTFLTTLKDEIITNPALTEVSEKYVEVDISSWKGSGYGLATAVGEWPLFQKDVQRVLLDGIPFVNPFAKGVYLSTQGLSELVEDRENAEVFWTEGEKIVSEEYELPEPVLRAKTFHVLASIRHADQTRSHANVIFKNGEEVVARVELRTPGQSIPWEQSDFRTFLNRTTLQNYERNHFHFRGQLTQSYPFVAVDSLGQKEIVFLYRIHAKPTTGRSRVTSIVIETNGESEAQVFIHGITIEQ